MATNKQRAGLAVAIASAIAIPAEGLRQWAYLDPPGILTVCYGSTTDVQRGKQYSLAECKTRLDADMLNAVTIVDKCAPGLPVDVLAAFADAAYNRGHRSPAISARRRRRAISLQASWSTHATSCRAGTRRAWPA